MKSGILKSLILLVVFSTAITLYVIADRFYEARKYPSPDDVSRLLTSEDTRRLFTTDSFRDVKYQHTSRSPSQDDVPVVSLSLSRLELHSQGTTEGAVSLVRHPVGENASMETLKPSDRTDKLVVEVVDSKKKPLSGDESAVKSLGSTSSIKPVLHDTPLNVPEEPATRDSSRDGVTLAPLVDFLSSSSSSSSFTNCTDDLCTNFLTELDKKMFSRCLRNATKKGHQMMRRQRQMRLSTTTTTTTLSLKLHEVVGNALLASGSCRFISGKGRGAVGLVSFPGSGNTWVRGLLQQVTGICTGAVYCDVSLRLGGFDGEGVQSRSVLVIKSHSSRPRWSTKLGSLEFGGLKNRILFDSVILIVRNPFHAMVSEWNRLLSTKYGLGSKIGLSHVEYYGEEFFLENSNWTRYVKRHVKLWGDHFEWVLTCPSDHHVMMVRYEDLKGNLLQQVQRMLAFLNYRYNHTALPGRLKMEGAERFYRHKDRDFEHYTLRQRTLVNKVIRSSAKKLYLKTGSTCGIEEYIWTDG